MPLEILIIYVCYFQDGLLGFSYSPLILAFKILMRKAVRYIWCTSFLSREIRLEGKKVSASFEIIAKLIIYF